MKKIYLKEIKTILIQSLLEIDKYCKNNNITYYLAGGTLLGAIRHDGFIPWDDDVDIYMPRKDYEIFIKKFNKDSNRLKIKTCYLDNKYPYPFAKVIDTKTKIVENSLHSAEMGIYIDVFPLDTFASYKDAKKIYRKMASLKGIWCLKTIPVNKKRNYLKNMILRVSKIFLFFVSENTIAKEMNKLAYGYKNENTESNYQGVVVWGYGIKKELFKIDIWDEKEEHFFEEHYFMIPKEYDKILKQIYGNYMNLPPQNERVTHHDYDAYLLD